MKLKRLAEDFQVEEQISLEPTGGSFALYRLTKQSLGTLEAIEAIRRRWNLPRQRLALAGLKDKHALTAQYVTIHRGQKRNLAESSFKLKYVGQCPRPVHASDIVANRFAIAIRDLTAGDIGQTTTALAAIDRDGLPNYYDNQRFGSLGQSGVFIAKPWCLGDYERALWLALADANVHDRSDEREAKQMVREHWGNWQKCLDRLRDSPGRSIFAHLAAKPNDFRRAITLVPSDVRSLWLAAFQSHLWNQVLAALIGQVCQASPCTMHTIGQSAVPFFPHLDAGQREQLSTVRLHLPSARLHLDEGPLKSLYDEVLRGEGMELRQVRVKYPRDSFFSKGERAALFRPGDLAYEFAADELYAGRQKLSLGFTLPRGSYATIVIKRLVGEASAGENRDSLSDET